MKDTKKDSGVTGCDLHGLWVERKSTMREKRGLYIVEFRTEQNRGRAT